MKYTDLKTFEDACKVLDLDAEKVTPDFSSFPENDQKAMLAHAQLIIIAKAANKLANKGKEWTPDWDNNKWDKWHPWFWMDGGSSGFQFYDSVSQDSDSSVGSRLCFKSRDLSDYAAKQFIDLYKQFMTI